MRRNEDERNITIGEELWVTACYSVGATMIISKSIELISKGCVKMIDKINAFELHKLIKDAVKYDCSVPQKKYDRLIEVFREEKEWVKVQINQPVVVRNEMIKTLSDLETAFRGARLTPYSVILAEKYCKNKVLIMKGWKLASPEEEKDAKPFEEERKELRKNFEEYLTRMGATQDQIDQLDKVYDELFKSI